MSECTHDCSNCSVDCDSRQPQYDALNDMSSVKRVIGVVSGKGGVGKSLVTSLLATLMNRRGYKTAILDADVTGPSIPKAFGIKERAKANEQFMFPEKTATGIDVMSINLLLENETDPVIWRGPVIAGVIKQFWQEVLWEDVDFMFVDMPPGTGDVPLTVFQSIPVDGIIVVTSPQELVSMIVGKAVNMAKMMNVPVLGLVENMSYFVCPDCGGKHEIFGKSKIEETAKTFGIENTDRIPIDAHLASLVDKGVIELFEGEYLDSTADMLEKKFFSGAESWKTTN